MTQHVALLRGINVGHNKRIAMADLRGLLTGLGYADVRTLLQSGNAVFTAAETSTGRVAEEVGAAIASELHLDVGVVVRTATELAAVVAGNPLARADRDPARLLVTFLSGRPDPDRLSAVDRPADAPDEVHVEDRAIYLWCPNGVLASPLSNAFWEAQLGLVATTRNWNTTTRLARLADR